MITKLQRWGNSQGIRLPKSLIDDLHLRENDKLDICQNGEVIILKKAQQHLTFEDRMRGYTGEYDLPEWDTGSPVGDEIF